MVRLFDSILDKLLSDALVIHGFRSRDTVAGLIQRIVPCCEIVYIGLPALCFCAGRSTRKLGFGLLEIGGICLRPSIAVGELCGPDFNIGLARYLATGESRVLGKRLEMPALRADGTEVR